MAMIRHLIPALGIIALAPAVMAEDKGPSVTFSGWSDNIFSVSDDNAVQGVTKHPPYLDTDPSSPSYGTIVPGTPDSVDPTAKSTQAPTARFSAAASLKATWKVGDKVTGKINAWFYPDTVNDGNNRNFQIRESYFTYQVTDTIGIKGGKYIDHLGWISAEPTGLYLVNGSIISYGQAYGNDVIGASLIVTPKDSPVVGEFHVTNGYYTGTDALSPGYVAPVSPSRENTDLGYGLDLTYTANEMISVNVEAAYDSHSSYNAGTAGLGGSVMLLGINATFKPIKDTLLIGAEFQSMAVGKGKDVGGADIGDTYGRSQGMLLANYVLPNTPFPMSVTGSAQYISWKDSDETNAYVDGAKTTATGLQAALLTNPTGSSNFGVNLEAGYKMFKHDPAPAGDELKGWETALEALVTF